MSIVRRQAKAMRVLILLAAVITTAVLLSGCKTFNMAGTLGNGMIDVPGYGQIPVAKAATWMNAKVPGAGDAFLAGDRTLIYLIAKPAVSNAPPLPMRVELNGQLKNGTTFTPADIAHLTRTKTPIAPPATTEELDPTTLWDSTGLLPVAPVQPPGTIGGTGGTVVLPSVPPADQSPGPMPQDPNLPPVVNP